MWKGLLSNDSALVKRAWDVSVTSAACVFVHIS